MTVIANPGFLAAAFMEAAATFLLLVLYLLLLPGFTARFFRYWLAGWFIFGALEAGRIYYFWRGTPLPHATLDLSVVATTCFFAAIWECSGQKTTLRYFWPLAVVVAAVLVVLGPVTHMRIAELWAECIIVCGLYIASGLIFWRWHPHQSGIGWKLLAGSLILRGLHGLDRMRWESQGFELARFSIHGFLGTIMGIAMAILVLESGRARTEDLSEKLRRLALITAEAVQSSLDEASQGILRHLVESLGVQKGVLFVLDETNDTPALVLRASVGFGDWSRNQYARVLTTEGWAPALLSQAKSFVALSSVRDPAARRWMDDEGLAVIVPVRVPGKQTPLGLLGIGSRAGGKFRAEEQTFLTNVGNLLGLAVENLALLENTATSRRQWLDTFDSIDDLIFVHSLDGRVLRANRALAARLDASLLFLLEHSVRDLLRQGDIPWTVCPYCEGAAGRPDQTDPTFGGYFLVSDSAFHNFKGTRLGTIHVLKDFTSRHQAETKFRTLFQKAQEGVFISTPEGRFADFNDALMRMLGYESREELLGADINELYELPTERDRLKNLLQEYGEVTDFEFRFRRRDGEIRVAHESSFATKDDTGGTVYQGFLLDVTEQKQAETDLRQRNRELLTLNTIAELLGQCSAIEDGLTASLFKVAELFTVDTSAVYLLDESAGALKLAAGVGYRTEPATRAAPLRLEETLLQQIRHLRATLISGAAPTLPEAWRDLNRREGVFTSQVVVLWAKDRVIGVLAVGRREARAFSAAEMNLLATVGSQIAAAIDKSLLLEQTREAYENLRRTQEQLLQSEKMAAVGQLISGVAHELNNPLTAILGYGHLLKSQDLVLPRGADYLSKLEKQAQRTHHIVQNLLSFARRHKPDRSAVDLNKIIDDTIALREYDIRANNIVIHREFDPKLPVTGGDSNQLQQVFLNIVNNALDAIQELGKPGEIWIRTEAAADRLIVEFTDNGPGVLNPHRIFDPFYTTKAVGKGTGLGLSICYGIIKEHGGEIQARNSPPRGATFSISLPLLVVAAEGASEHPSQEPCATMGSVLLVDTEEPVLHLEHEILMAAGATVLIARSTAEAIDILKRNPVDTMVCDMNMPGSPSTPGLYHWIEQNCPDLAGRVIFTSSFAVEDQKTRALKKSGCQILVKPFQIEEFCRIVRSVAAGSVHSPAVGPVTTSVKR
jgi:PAS domain S-box-containing protein